MNGQINELHGEPLHAGVWDPNPTDLFAQWNPA
jgi:hypothetical protein